MKLRNVPEGTTRLAPPRLHGAMAPGVDPPSEAARGEKETLTTRALWRSLLFSGVTHLGTHPVGYRRVAVQTGAVRDHSRPWLQLPTWA